MTDADHPESRIVVHLDRLLAERDMTLIELADRVGITVANLSILKNGRSRAIRFSTLTALCDVLGCEPGDLLTCAPPEPSTTSPATEPAHRRRQDSTEASTR